MNDQLLNAIAADLNIRRGTSEVESDFKTRIVYSAIARQAYASLFDRVDTDRSTVSIRHFKDRISELQSIYAELYPEVQLAENLPIDIYRLYLKTGGIYYTPNRIAASMPSSAVQDGIKFMRGVTPDQKVRMSGAGFFLPSSKTSVKTVAEMFALPNKTLLETWDELIRSAKWRVETMPVGTQFFVDDKWFDKPARSGEISIARFGECEPRTYYLCKFDGDKFECSQLPRWRIYDERFSKTYRRVTFACRAARGTLPPIKFKIDGAIVNAKCTYLPPSELNLLNLYSWSQQSARTFDAEVFFALKNILERIGYSFIEE